MRTHWFVTYCFRTGASLLWFLTPLPIRQLCTVRLPIRAGNLGRRLLSSAAQGALPSLLVCESRQTDDDFDLFVNAKCIAEDPRLYCNAESSRFSLLRPRRATLGTSEVAVSLRWSPTRVCTCKSYKGCGSAAPAFRARAGSRAKAEGDGHAAGRGKETTLARSLPRERRALHGRGGRAPFASTFTLPACDKQTNLRLPCAGSTWTHTKATSEAPRAAGGWRRLPQSLTRAVGEALTAPVPFTLPCAAPLTEQQVYPAPLSRWLKRRPFLMRGARGASSVRALASLWTSFIFSLSYLLLGLRRRYCLQDQCLSIFRSLLFPDTTKYTSLPLRYIAHILLKRVRSPL